MGSEASSTALSFDGLNFMMYLIRKGRFAGMGFIRTNSWLSSSVSPAMRIATRFSRGGTDVPLGLPQWLFTTASTSFCGSPQSGRASFSSSALPKTYLMSFTICASTLLRFPVSTSPYICCSSSHIRIQSLPSNPFSISSGKALSIAAEALSPSPAVAGTAHSAAPSKIILICFIVMFLFVFYTLYFSFSLLAVGFWLFYMSC